MNKKENLIFFLILILLVNCSFDNKTGIWDSDKDEKKRIAELEKKQIKKIYKKKIYSSENIYSEEKILINKISLLPPKKNLSWEMPGLNHQNLLGNIYLSGIDNKFLKKKIGKNKFSMSRIMSPPLVYNNNIFFSDDNGTIFNINHNGKINWKKNIYKKIYKKIYKNLTFSIYKNNIYVADNIGFIYTIDLNSGKLIWIKNHGVPLKSKIKVFDNSIFLINQDNRLLSFSAKDGSIIWNIHSVSSFIKSQNFLALAISKNGYLAALNSSGDLLNVNAKNGRVIWSLNTTSSLLAHDTDFWKSSDIIIDESKVTSKVSNI